MGINKRIGLTSFIGALFFMCCVLLPASAFAGESADPVILINGSAVSTIGNQDVFDLRIDEGWNCGEPMSVGIARAGEDWEWYYLEHDWDNTYWNDETGSAYVAGIDMTSYWDGLIPAGEYYFYIYGEYREYFPGSYVFSVFEGKTPTEVEVELQGIEIAEQPAKILYKVGDTLDLTGLLVRADYSDGSSALVDDYTTSPAAGAQLNEAGAVQVEVNFQDWTAQFEITVEAEAASYAVILDGSCQILVADCYAYINATITGADSSAGLLAALFAGTTPISDPVSVADGQVRLYAFVPGDAGEQLQLGLYLEEGNLLAVDTITVRHPEGLWTPLLTEQDGSIMIVFTEPISLTATAKAAINGATTSVQVEDGQKSLRLNGSLKTGDVVVVSGVKYPELFPSYSFTFTLRSEISGTVPR